MTPQDEKERKAEAMERKKLELQQQARQQQISP